MIIGLSQNRPFKWHIHRILNNMANYEYQLVKNIKILLCTFRMNTGSRKANLGRYGQLRILSVLLFRFLWRSLYG